nr:hypothetical protein [Tanacetum cinerariifolium]
MLAEKSNDHESRELFLLSNKSIRKIRLPEIYGKACWYSSCGWLLTIGEDFASQLINPLSREIINLPKIDTFPGAIDPINWEYAILKVVLVLESNLVLIVWEFKKLGFCHIGDNKWTSVEHGLDNYFIQDIAFYNEEVYTFDFNNNIQACNVNEKDQAVLVHLATIPEDVYYRHMTTSSANNSVFKGFFEKQKLTGFNFINWYRQLRIILSIEDKLNYLEKPIPPALNYNMHSLGKTINKLHAMLKLYEQTLPKNNAPALHAIRADKVQKKRNYPQYLAELLKKKKNITLGAGGSGLLKNMSLVYLERWQGNLTHIKWKGPKTWSNAHRLFQKKVDNQLGKTIKSLRFDRRGEYMSQEFLDHLNDHGIIGHCTPPYTPQHNGPEGNDMPQISIKDNEVWLLVELPPNGKTVGCKWLFKKKTDIDGVVHTYETRLVSKGYTQTLWIDYEETFSPVADKRDIRILIAILATKY